MDRTQLIEIIQNMRAASQLVVDRWSTGDLAAAVNELEDTIGQADEAIAWWESE